MAKQKWFPVMKTMMNSINEQFLLIFMWEKAKNIVGLDHNNNDFATKNRIWFRKYGRFNSSHLCLLRELVCMFSHVLFYLTPKNDKYIDKVKNWKIKIVYLFLLLDEMEWTIF